LIEPIYNKGGIRLYHGDARVVLPEVAPEGKMILTDPPYGIEYNNHRGKPTYRPMENNGEGLDLSFLFDFPLPQVIWGANNFPQILPYDRKRDGWLVWDKRCSESADKMIGSPFEAAVVLGKHLYKFIRLQHGGVVNADGWRIKRVHPTQKPIGLMTRCLEYFPSLVPVDPFVGSGTTLVAARRLGREGIGIELDEQYCKLAIERLEADVAKD
jgi:site-specific DNA-methyltransferase (adenine-specific)